MRKLALAAAVCLGVSFAGVAAARDWTDPNGRINFSAPNGWNIDPMNTADATSVLTFDGSHDCYVIGLPNANTSSASVERINRAVRDPFPPASWTTVANSISDFFPGQSAQVVSQSVDTSGFWPVQRATLQSPQGEVFAAVQSRPGVDLMAFCRALGGSSTAMFDGVFASISHPNDAAWRQAAEQQAAAPATTTPAPEEQAPQQERRRRN